MKKSSLHTHTHTTLFPQDKGVPSLVLTRMKKSSLHTQNTRTKHEARKPYASPTFLLALPVLLTAHTRTSAQIHTNTHIYTYSISYAHSTVPIRAKRSCDDFVTMKRKRTAVGINHILVHINPSQDFCFLYFDVSQQESASANHPTAGGMRGAV